MGTSTTSLQGAPGSSAVEAVTTGRAALAGAAGAALSLGIS
jgi:hypothetical protein